MHFLRRVAPFLCALLFVFGVVVAQTAIPLPLPDLIDPVLVNNPITGNLPDPNDPNYVSQDVLGQGGLFGRPLLRIFNVIIGAIAIVYFVLVAIRMIFARGNTEQMARYRQELIWIAAGLFIVSVAEIAAYDILDPVSNPVTEAKATVKLTEVVRRILNVLKYIMGGFVLLATLISGYNLIVDGDNSDVEQKEKDFFQSFFLGIFLVLFAETAVLLISLPEIAASAEMEAIRDSSREWSKGILLQLGGTVNFMTTFFTAMAVLMVVFGALYYVTSYGDESRMEQGKRILIGAIVSLVIILSSYAIANILINN